MKRYFIIYTSNEAMEASIRHAERVLRRHYNMHGFRRVNSGKTEDGRVFVAVDLGPLPSVFGEDHPIEWFHNMDEIIVHA